VITTWQALPPSVRSIVVGDVTPFREKGSLNVRSPRTRSDARNFWEETILPLPVTIVTDSG
jgi:hypothetical protein